MRERLARSFHAVMTSRAATRLYPDMVEARGCPSNRGMASFAGVGRGDVIHRLARRNAAVMAGETGAGDLRVIDTADWFP